MSYLTPTEFRATAFRSGSLVNLSDAEIQAQLDVASSEIDAALRPTHTLPLATPVPALILEAERVLAAHRLMLFRGRKPVESAGPDGAFERRYQEIQGGSNVEWKDSVLGKLSTGRLILAKEADATLNREGRPFVVSSRNGASQAREFNDDGCEVF
jgi:hypothetical protein